MTRRKVGNPLALAVLACLAERPMHPYEMATTLRERHKDEAIRLNYGALYAIIEALNKHLFIEPKERIKQGKRPERTVYTLTEAGLHELNDWLGELLATPVKEYTQYEAGLSLLPHITPEEALSLLDRRCESLELKVMEHRSVLAFTRSKNLPKLFVVDSEYRLTMREAELAWTRALIEEIRSGTLEGMQQWRSYEDAESKEPKS